MARVRHLDDSAMLQLVKLAAGFLGETRGDITAAMQRALAGHRDLLGAVRAGEIRSRYRRGALTMLVPPEGGIALSFARHAEAPSFPNYDFSDFEVLEPTTRSEADVGPRLDAGVLEDWD